MGEQDAWGPTSPHEWIFCISKKSAVCTGKKDGLVAESDERLWFTLMDFATVYSETDVRLTFKNGVEIQS
jgi:hypothetical protein